MATNKEKGDAYENFVYEVYLVLLFSEFAGVETVTLEKKWHIVDINGCKREIDIYWEYLLLGDLYKTAIECKYYNTSVGIEKVEAFAQKLRSLRLNKGIMASQVDFASGAIKTAEGEGITLLKIRKPDVTDWDGYISELTLNIHAIHPPRIKDIRPTFNKQWIEEECPDAMEHIAESRNYLNTEIFIRDVEANTRKSFFDIAKMLPGSEPGDHQHVMKFENAFLEFGPRKIKLREIIIDYMTFEISTMESTVDVKPFALAFMEYITQERKKIMVMKDGRQQSWDDSADRQS